MEGIELLNGKIMIQNRNHYGRVMEMCNRMGAKWQSGDHPFGLSLSSHFQPKHIYVKEGVMTWDGRQDKHIEECHARFWRNPLPLVEVA